jgi:uncharacterized protein
MAHPNEDLARRLHDAFAAGDREKLAGCFAENVLWHMPGKNELAGDWEGREDVLAHLAKIAELTDGTYKTEPRDVLVSDERAAMLYRATGHRGERMLDLDQMILLDVRDGQVVEVRVIPEDQYLYDAFWG